jgi:hypothetical protein
MQLNFRLQEFLIINCALLIPFQSTPFGGCDSSLPLISFIASITIYSMGRVVIVGYKPKPGREEDLKELLRIHIPCLRSNNLVSEMEPVLMKSSNGTYLEVFEWQSSESVEKAHNNQEVKNLWNKFQNAATYELLLNLEEFVNPFPDFEAIEL